MTKLINAFTNDALETMDATAVAHAIATKQISAEEAIEAAIKRAQKVNPELNAIALETYADARKFSKIKHNGGLYGVPCFIKDTDPIAGYPTQLGSGSFKAKIAKQNGKFINQLFSTGLISLGKSTMPEFGLLCSKESKQWGTTRNPWNTAYTSGGSSSGSAALVASGAVPIASGNDGAGSIRIPAAICGLVGFKPTRNRLYSVEGTESLPIQTIHQGVLTRSVRDTALFLSEAEKFYYNKKLPKLNHVQFAGKQKLKIAVFHNQPEGTLGFIDAENEQAQLKAVKLLTSLGHHVDQIQIPVDVERMKYLYVRFFGFQAYMTTRWSRFSLKAKVDLNLLENFSKGLSKQFSDSMLKFPFEMKEMLKLGAQYESVFEKYDVIMTPTMSHKTPKIGYFSSENSFEENMDKAAKFGTYSPVQNVTGSPAISLPFGFDSDKMPIGIQFIAPYGLDERLLKLAYEIEEAQPWKSIYQV